MQVGLWLISLSYFAGFVLSSDRYSSGISFPFQVQEDVQNTVVAYSEAMDVVCTFSYDSSIVPLEFSNSSELEENNGLQHASLVDQFLDSKPSCLKGERMNPFSYEVCFGHDEGATIYQFETLNRSGTKRLVGQYNEQATHASRDNGSYNSLVYDTGDRCDEKPRSALVKFHCDESYRLITVIESSFCFYSVHVGSPHFCQSKDYFPPYDTRSYRSNLPSEIDHAQRLSKPPLPPTLSQIVDSLPPAYQKESSKAIALLSKLNHKRNQVREKLSNAPKYNSDYTGHSLKNKAWQDRGKVVVEDLPGTGGITIGKDDRLRHSSRWLELTEAEGSALEQQSTWNINLHPTEGVPSFVHPQQVIPGSGDSLGSIENPPEMNPSAAGTKKSKYAPWTMGSDTRTALSNGNGHQKWTCTVSAVDDLRKYTDDPLVHSTAGVRINRGILSMIILDEGPDPTVSVAHARGVNRQLLQTSTEVQRRQVEGKDARVVSVMFEYPDTDTGFPQPIGFPSLSFLTITAEWENSVQ